MLSSQGCTEVVKMVKMNLGTELHKNSMNSLLPSLLLPIVSTLPLLSYSVASPFP